MSRLSNWVLLGGVALCSLTSGIASASDAASGIIRFTGQIVESPCVASAQQAVVNFSCYQEGKQANYRYNTNSATAANQVLPDLIEETRMDWLNAERTARLLTVTYR
ncbi:hypothetical protein BIY26_00355 [Brenneria goodwinii]|uniref:Type 1 fimbrial protein n=1 Tax=Brenneria goodwinii TaxID=1109412 RepID=A0AAE8ES90_9GAMM|nr:hypothetical protein [Brenneria goodwinii]ATA24350.1 hypothetical protein AWC36_09605 [Brenneria goodwinii]MCG8154994.1 hypothetical protein [Brenneria goodwinii]MCG8159238.1 hypothetical protein [Brenneria goodwinii]MCG8168234.1 hypothetical protein [Brenneria goodwinii]MCG8168841.1 hypothetical protein [Brenneria goodwinii]